MVEEETNLQELMASVDSLFDVFKDEISHPESPTVQSLLVNVHNKIDFLLLLVKYEINQFLRDKFNNGELRDTQRGTLTQRKAECLIDLQRLTSDLTCRVLADYTKVKEEENRGFPA